MPVQTIEPQRLYRKIASQIATLVETGEFRVGERLPPERDLSEQLGVSRSSVREALIALEIEGVVEVRSGSGIYVRSKAARDVTLGSPQSPLGPFDVIKARTLLETEIAVLAVTHATQSQFADIWERLETLHRVEVGAPDLIAADRDFHLSIARASGNMAYVLLLDTLWDHRTTPLYARLENHFHSSKVWKQSMTEHDQIFAALSARDAGRVAAAMRAHMHNAEKRLASKLD